jgi:hypothetical protein
MIGMMERRKTHRSLGGVCDINEYLSREGMEGALDLRVVRRELPDGSWSHISPRHSG